MVFKPSIIDKFIRLNLSVEWDSIRSKHIVRWQHLSQIKAWLFWLVENIFFQLKTQQSKSGTCAATYKLMEHHWLRPFAER